MNSWVYATMRLLPLVTILLWMQITQTDGCAAVLSLMYETHQRLAALDTQVNIFHEHILPGMNRDVVNYLFSDSPILNTNDSHQWLFTPIDHHTALFILAISSLFVLPHKHTDNGRPQRQIKLDGRRVLKWCNYFITS